MGKKRERELRDDIDELLAVGVLHAKRDEEAKRRADEGLAAALKSMGTDPFLIVTKSGHVIKGRAKDVQMNQATATFGMGSWAERVPCGPREYSANITIEPITNSEV